MRPQTVEGTGGGTVVQVHDEQEVSVNPSDDFSSGRVAVWVLGPFSSNSRRMSPYRTILPWRSFWTFRGRSSR